MLHSTWIGISNRFYALEQHHHQSQGHNVTTVTPMDLLPATYNVPKRRRFADLLELMHYDSTLVENLDIIKKHVQINNVEDSCLMNHMKTNMRCMILKLAMMEWIITYR